MQQTQSTILTVRSADFKITDIPTSPDKQKTYRATERGKSARLKERKAGYTKRAKLAYAKRQRRQKPFVGWDGEGVNRPDGSHDYVLLANSQGQRIKSLDRLTTPEIFTFLWETASADVINVIYGASYDWNCWLADLTEDELRRLYETGRLYWREWSIAWRRGKTFRISRGDKSVTFYDVVSFFQTTFVNACDSYLGERFESRDLIVENKRLRSDFHTRDLDTIIKYNDAELVNLVHLMNELRERLVKADLFPSRWDGPGAVAVALLQREGIKPHLQQHDERVMPAIRSAYFGGRFEVIKFGHVKAKAYEYDINSAYPYALQYLPSLAGGTWKLVRGDAGPHPYALYHVTYQAKNGNTVLPQPLPRRHHDGTVSYPAIVRGWYWSPEIEVTRRYVEKRGGKLTIHKTWVFTPATDEKPFGFIPELYEKRAALKAAGDGAHVAIKLAINSIYGKTCQQVGWKINPDGSLRIPPYHQLDWAGFITSTCRAKVLDACLDNLHDVIAFETDAMFSAAPLNVTIGSGLGEWDELVFDDLTYLQSGTYFGRTGKKQVAKTRGVDRGTLPRSAILKAYRQNRERVSATLTRFIGAGLALRGQWENWRKWISTPKSLALFPSGKRFHATCPSCQGTDSLDVGRWHTTLVTPRDGIDSCEFPIGWANPNSDMSLLDEMREAAYEGDSYED